MENINSHLIKPSEGIKLYNLSVREIVLCKKLLSQTDQNLWFVWQEGWENWKRLSEVNEELYSFDSENAPVVPETLTQVSDEVSAPGFLANKDYTDKLKKVDSVVDTIDDVEIEIESEFHYREHKRIGKRFKIAIEASGKVFETHTIDISVGGALLEDPLPEWVVGYSNISITKIESSEVFNHTCALVDSQPPDQRFRVLLAPLKTVERQQKFQAWLST